jgi:sugar lactone lactonase YvrE
VANSFTDTLTSYAATADGNIRPLATVSGSATGLAGPQGIAFDPSGRVVVANSGHGSSVTEYAVGAHGDATPATTISGPDTGLSDPFGVAFDANGDLFVSNPGNDSVTEYAPGASGDAQPVATLTGAATGLHVPNGLIFDTAGRLSVANAGANTVTTYAPGANGDAAPAVTLGGAATKLSEPNGLGLDASGQLYVGNFTNLVTVFRRGAAGDVAPVRTLAGTATALDGVTALLVVSAPSATTLPTAGLSATTAELAGTISPHGGPTSYYFQYGPTTAYGSTTVPVNAGAGPGPKNVFATITHLTPSTVTHYRIVTTSSAGTASGADRTFTTASAGLTAVPMVYSSNAPALAIPGSSSPASILGFPVGSRGNLAPTIAISGPHTGLSAPVGLAVDGHGDVFTADFNANQILEYAPGAHGDVAPIADIPVPQGPNGGGPAGLAITPTGTLVVSRFQDPAILEFVRDSAGKWGLLHTIAGDQTRLDSPVGVASGPGGTIAVADQLAGQVLEFSQDADGNVAPFRSIGGSDTGLDTPTGVAVDDTGTLWVADQTDNDVSVFGAGATGDATPLRTIHGAATGVSQPFAVAPDGAGHVVVGNVFGKIGEFTRAASGNQPPFATVGGSQTGLLSVLGLAISPPLLGISTASLPTGTTGTTYAQTLGATGGARPYHWSLSAGSLPAGLSLNSSTGAITGAPTTPQTSNFTVKVTDASKPTAQSTTQALSIDVRRPVLPSVYTVNGASGTVTDYALTPLGNASPLLTLGPANRLNAPSGVAVDPMGRLYVVNGGANSVSEFAPGATATAPPDVTISGAATGLASPSSIALDSTGKIYVTSRSAASISVFATGTAGNTAPTATISGPHTALNAPAAATVTSAGDIWVADAGNNSLTEYAPGANGDAAPMATVSGPATILNMPVALGQDEQGNLLVANLFSKSVTRFPPNANGNVSPDAVLQGVDTTLDFPDGVDVDAQGRIYVSNEFNNSIAVFAPDASGDAVPLGTIAGAATGLSGPGQIAVAPPLSILTTTLPGATVRHVYQATLQAALGTTPYRWSVKASRLPRGLRLTPDGVLSGVPRRPGVSTFTVLVTDSSHPRMTDRRRLSVTVRCPPAGMRRTCAIARRPPNRRRRLVAPSVVRGGPR